jgi:hypothetical protein
MSSSDSNHELKLNLKRVGHHFEQNNELVIWSGVWPVWATRKFLESSHGTHKIIFLLLVLVRVFYPIVNNVKAAFLEI